MEKYDDSNENITEGQSTGKKPIGLIVTLVALVVLIAGASILYKTFGDDVDVSQLNTEQGVATEAPAGAEEAVGGDTTAQSASTSPVTEEPDSTAQSNQELTLAPDITIYDLDGNSYKLSDFRGKPVVVNFWSSNCGPCKKEMPEFEVMYQQYGDEIQFLMVNITDGYWDTIDSASSFIEDSGYTFPVYYDTDNNASYAYGVSALPTTYFIDAEGHGIAYAMGAIDKDTLLKGIDMIAE